MNRGIRHGAIFFGEENCSYFLELLGEAVERFGIRIHAYVLMGNHYHLLVESVRGNLSDAMKMISQGYTQYLNRSPRFDGPIFKGRFKNKVVSDESYWHHLLIYLHMNPVRAQLVGHASAYNWSSQSVYAGERVGPDWLCVNDLLAGYGGEKGYNQYFAEYLTGKGEAPEGFSSVLFDPGQRITSTKQDMVGTYTRRTPEQALDEVAALCGVAVQDLKSSARGCLGNSPRALAIWWLVFGAGLGSSAAGRQLNMTAGAVSKTLAKWKSRSDGYRNEQLWEWKKTLETKGQ